jgi:DNA repair exonuclease SbcCD ATPase subunit
LGKTQEISNLECENENLLINLKYLASQKKILDEKNKFHEELVATISNIKSSKEYTENIFRKIEFAEEHVVTCSNCNHKVFPDLDIDVSKKEEVLASINEYESSLKEKMEIISILNSELNSLKQELLGGKILKQTIELNKEKIVKLKEELDEIQKYIPSVQDNVSLIDMEKTLVEVKQELDIIYKEKDDLDFIQNAISSDNIKGLIISQELPFLNKFINEYLEKFSLIGYNLIIDKNFKDKIISRTEDNEYNQMSNGQKARINFSIMFALLKMVEQRNGVSFNILVLDEVLDSSLDSLGREELLGILYSDFRQNKNVIIISHNQEIKEKLEFFSRIIEIEMNTFSSINISKV